MLRRFIVGLLFTILFSVVAYAGGTYAVVTGSRVNVRSYAEIGADNRLFQVERGTRFEISGASGDFFRGTINGREGVYISRDFARITQAPGMIIADIAHIKEAPTGNRFASIAQGATVVVRYVYENMFAIEWNGEIAFASQADIEIPYFASLPTARIGNALATEIIQTAKNYLGTRYLWGGTTPAGFDCSGFMVFLFTPHGIELSRSSRNQARNGIHVPREELIPGDLIFFGSGSHINHVGLYIGNNQFIHSSSHQTGGVIICNLQDPHNDRGFVTARRVIF